MKTNFCAAPVCAELAGQTVPLREIIRARMISRRGTVWPASSAQTGAAQKFVFIEDAYLRHVPWIDSQGDGFPDVGRKRCRDVAEVQEVNAVRSHLASLG